MTGDVEHVVDAALEPVVAVGVDGAAVTGGEVAREHREVDVLEALAVVVAPRAADHAGPRSGDDEVTVLADAGGLALVGEHGGLHAEERTTGGTRLEGHGAGQRGDHVAAGLGLPPRVAQRDAALADLLVVPHPAVGIDGLAHGGHDAQGLHGVLHRPLVALADEAADDGRRGVDRGGLVLLDDLPVAVRLRIGRQTLVEEAGGAEGERAVHDVAVARDPADVGGAEVDVVVVEVEDVLAWCRARRAGSHRWCG